MVTGNFIPVKEEIVSIDLIEKKPKIHSKVKEAVVFSDNISQNYNISKKISIVKDVNYEKKNIFNKKEERVLLRRVYSINEIINC